MFVANGKTIIVHEDIDNLYNRFSDLAIRFAQSYKSINSTLMGVEGCYRRSGGKQNVALTCMLQSQRLLNVCGTLNQGAELLRMSKDQMRTLDQIIRQEVNNTDLPSLSQLSFGDSTDSNTEIWKSEKEYWDSYINTHYVSIFDEDGNVRPPYNKYIAYGRYTFGNEADTMQCVGYAWARFEELSGEAPGFSCGYAGNIGNCYPDSFEQVTDFTQLKLPALAYNYGTTNNPNGHVVVIEGFATGPNGEQIVYYTEANVSGCADGTLHSASFDSFSGVIQLK